MRVGRVGRDCQDGRSRHKMWTLIIALYVSTKHSVSSICKCTFELTTPAPEHWRWQTSSSSTMSWRLKSSGEAQGGAKKRKAGGDKKDKEEKDPMVPLMKLALWNAQQVRVLASASLTTWSIQSSKSLVVAAEEAGKAYSKAVAEEGRGHKRGSPHCHVAMAAIEAMGGGEAAMEDGSRELLRRFASVMEQGGLKAVAEAVAYFKVKQMYKREGQGEERHIVWLALHPNYSYKEEDNMSQHRLFKAIDSVMVQEGGVRLTGTPPKNELERVVEEFLKKAQKGGSSFQ